MSRLLTVLLQHRHGFEVGRHVSLDRIVEEERTRDYEVLRQRSAADRERDIPLSAATVRLLLRRLKGKPRHSAEAGTVGPVRRAGR